MNATIITAIISGLSVAIPTIVSVIVTSNSRDAVIEERIKYLSEKMDALGAKVQLHNNFESRIVALERDLKTAFTWLNEMRKQK